MSIEGFAYFLHDPFTQTLVGLAIVFVCAYLAGRLFARFGQPEVIGEVIVGILLGPSLLGSTSTHLFPPAGRPLLQILADIGVAVFMFTVGLEMDFGRIRSARHHRVASTIALFATLVPFALGLAIAPILHHSNPHAALLPFYLFIGVSLSITAFPVLARILEFHGLTHKPIGELSLVAAAIADAGTWVVLALVVATVGSRGWLQAPYALVLTIAFMALLVGVVRPFLRRWSDSQPTPAGLLLVLAGIMACAAVTSGIGLQIVFGAFAFGAMFPRGTMSDGVRSMLEPICTLLLPVFFVTTGLQVDVRVVGATGLLAFVLVLCAACAGKFLGAGLGGTLHLLRPRDSLGIGALMNTRGLTELIVLTIGLKAKVLNTELFTAFVGMAIVTTFATSPLLALIKPDAQLHGRRRGSRKSNVQPAANTPPR
jgi:Kef-type K+ transport system membrane component KefB